MQQMLDLGEIKERAGRLGVTMIDLAGDAGIDPSTAYRGAQGGNVTIRTARKLSSALIEQELRLLKYLARLYPDEALKFATTPEEADDRQLDIEAAIGRSGGAR